MSRPRLQDVARRAGVSLATVSRVINGRPGVAGATRQQVLDVLGELGYQDAPTRPHHNGVVGIVTPEMDTPIFPLLAQSIESRLARHGFLAMICPSTSDTVHEQEYLDHFAQSRMAGAVVVNGRYSMVEVGYGPYLSLEERGVPTVLVNATTADCPLPAVAVDIRAGGAMAVRHLATLGHRRIGCLVGPSKYVSARDLEAGFRVGLDEAALVSEEGFVGETLYTVEGGRAGVAQLLEAGVTGVVTGSDLMALGAIAGIRARGARVPEDISVVGFDGTALVTYTDPPLTSVRQPVERMAATAVSLLVGANGSGANVHVFQPDLMIGRSTGAVAS